MASITSTWLSIRMKMWETTVYGTSGSSKDPQCCGTSAAIPTFIRGCISARKPDNKKQSKDRTGKLKPVGTYSDPSNVLRCLEQRAPCVARAALFNGFRRSFDDQTSSCLPSFRAQINDPIR